MKGGELKQCFAKICGVESEIGKQLRMEGYEYMHNDHLGFIAACPSNVGTSLRASVTVDAPLLSQTPDLQQICKAAKLRVQADVKRDGVYTISNNTVLGQSEVELLNNLIDAVSQVVAKEKELEVAHARKA